MKNFLIITILVILLFGLLLAISAFIGRDLILNLVSLTSQKANSNNQQVIDRFAVLSDTHSDDEYTAKAVAQAKKLGINYIIVTGDFTKVGTIAELQSQKKIFDESGVPYWAIMGDHDRWQSAEKNFELVFGKIYESFDRNNIHHILLDASDLTNGLGNDQLTWFENDVEKNKDKEILIFMHLPIYHPTSDRTIGDKGGTDPERQKQTERFLSIIKGKKIIAMFSGDHHLSSSYTEPTTSAKIFISGAVTRERNLQTPRFSLVEIYSDYSIKVEDQVIK